MKKLKIECQSAFYIQKFQNIFKIAFENHEQIVNQVIHIRSRKDTAVVTIPESDKPVTKRDIEKLYDLSFLFFVTFCFAR